MSIKTQEELFVRLLSNVKYGTERTGKILQELAGLVDDPDIKEAFEARAFVSDQIVAKLDRCFKMIGAQPVKGHEEIRDVFIEDFRKELAEIQQPAAKKLFVLVKAIHLLHARIAEYVALIAVADVTGHYGVGVLLESCLADKLAFVERTKRLLTHVAEIKILEKMAR